MTAIVEIFGYFSQPTAFLMSGCPEYPVALGVIRSVDGPTYDMSVQEQIEGVKKTAKIKCMDDLLKSGSTWSVG